MLFQITDDVVRFVEWFPVNEETGDLIHSALPYEAPEIGRPEDVPIFDFDL
jgi:hypothetical protein